MEPTTCALDISRWRDGDFDDIGTWVLSSDGSTLVLKGGRYEPLLFSWTDGGRALTKLDLEGPIESTESHELVRVAAPTLLEPRLSMRGLFTYMADSPVFAECLTGRKLPVAMEADYVSLERAYLEKRAEPGQALFANVEGRIVERVNMEGPARPMLVVEPFVGLTPGKSCGARFATEPFENTYWKLTELNGTAVVPSRGAMKRTSCSREKDASAAPTDAIACSGATPSKQGGSRSARWAGR